MKSQDFRRGQLSACQSPSPEILAFFLGEEGCAGRKDGNLAVVWCRAPGVLFCQDELQNYAHA